MKKSFVPLILLFVLVQPLFAQKDNMGWRSGNTCWVNGKARGVVSQVRGVGHSPFKQSWAGIFWFAKVTLSFQPTEPNRLLSTKI